MVYELGEIFFGKFIKGKENVKQGTNNRVGLEMKYV